MDLEVADRRLVNSRKNPDASSLWSACRTGWWGRPERGVVIYMIGVREKRGVMLVDAMFVGMVDELGSFSFVPLRMDGVDCHPEQSQLRQPPPTY